MKGLKIFQISTWLALDSGTVQDTLQSLAHITGKRWIQAISQPKMKINANVPSLRETKCTCICISIDVTFPSCVCVSDSITSSVQPLNPLLPPNQSNQHQKAKQVKKKFKWVLFVCLFFNEMWWSQFLLLSYEGYKDHDLFLWGNQISFEEFASCTILNSFIWIIFVR